VISIQDDWRRVQYCRTVDVMRNVSRSVTERRIIGTKCGQNSNNNLRFRVEVRQPGSQADRRGAAVLAFIRHSFHRMFVTRPKLWIITVCSHYFPHTTLQGLLDPILVAAIGTSLLCQKPLLSHHRHSKH